MLGSNTILVCVLAMSADDSLSVTDATDGGSLSHLERRSSPECWKEEEWGSGEAVSVFLTISGIVSRL